MKYLIFVLLLTLMGCTDAPKAERILREQGYSNITITGWRFGGCSNRDTFATGFKALSPVGRKCSGTVCSDWFKGTTIRFD